MLCSRSRPGRISSALPFRDVLRSKAFLCCLHGTQAKPSPLGPSPRGQGAGGREGWRPLAFGPVPPIAHLCLQACSGLITHVPLLFEGRGLTCMPALCLVNQMTSCSRGAARSPGKPVGKCSVSAEAQGLQELFLKRGVVIHTA